MADRFYTADPLGPGEHILTGAEAHHMLAVRRFAPGDYVTLFNGDGNEYPSEVVAVEKKAVTLRVLRTEPADRELPFPLVVASALPKGDRADFLVEKLTELGVTRFIPLLTERSVVKPKDSVVEKFARAVIEASKQCGRNRLMTVDAPREWSAFVTVPNLPPTRFVLHTGNDLPRMERGTGGVGFAIGPEGGFTAEEVNAALAAGWRAVSLGRSVLRVETAALVAAALAANAV